MRGIIGDPEIKVARFVTLGRIGDELFGLNTQSGRINRIETGDLEALLRIPLLSQIEMVGLNRHHLPDQARPELLGGGSLRRISETIKTNRLKEQLDQHCVAENAHLLGTSGPSVAYAQLDGNRPSVALVKIHKQLALERNTRSNKLCATFPFRANILSFPLLDARAISTFPPELDRLDKMDEISDQIGFRPRYLLIALARVHKGYCKKVVVSVLPEL